MQTVCGELPHQPGEAPCVDTLSVVTLEPRAEGLSAQAGPRKQNAEVASGQEVGSTHFAENVGGPSDHRNPRCRAALSREVTSYVY